MMLVDRKDGACPRCGGVLRVIDAGDATMTVTCTDCGDIYLVEPDAFGDGCMDYYLDFLTGEGRARPRRAEGGDA
jgi:hypothetical protein